MWSRASTDIAACEADLRLMTAGTPGGWRARSRSSCGALSRAVRAAAPVVALIFLSACGSTPTKPLESAPEAATPSSAAVGQSGSAPVALTPRGKADFERAVGFMRAGNTTEAELEFKQIALQFPQLATPYVNLGILYRKTGHLDQSEEALKSAVERSDGNAVAWTELGATQRMRGEFPNAAASYEHAIASDPNFAPAYRNLGVVSDLYLGDPERALTAFERYKELTGEEKPVSGWIAELRQRTGKPPLKRPAAPAAAPSEAAPGQNPTASPEGEPGQNPAEPAAAAAPSPKAGV
jgi:tetratricopeptide (TPR) repeat protein